jgi:septum formation protein
VKVKVISKQELDLFISTKQWYGNAGGYTLRGFAAMFIEQIRGTESNIIGLPLCLTYKALNGVGIAPNLYINH